MEYCGILYLDLYVDYMMSSWCQGEGMDAAHAQQLIEAGVAVEGGGAVEMMVMESLDPALLQMKTEVNYIALQPFFLCNILHMDPR